MILVRLALVLGAFAFTATSASAQPAKAAAPVAEPGKLSARDGPSEGELEYWRSVQRIDTPAAYRSYVESFPNGYFLGLARLKATAAAAAPAKAGEAPAAQVAAPTLPRPGASLNSFSEPLANSGAITLNLGDRLNGPGLLTVGSLGARKQLVVPAGEWVLLSAADTKSVQVTTPYGRESTVGVTTLMFGRFVGDRMASLLRIITNRQVAHVNTWTDFAGCDRSTGTAGLEHARTRSGLRDECSSLRVEQNPVERLLAASEEAKASLARLGASVSGAGLVSNLSFADPRLGYLGITRIDWPGTVLGASAERAAAWRSAGIENFAAHQSYLKRLGDWSQAYRKLATDGYLRSFESTDIVANAPARPGSELLALGDFDLTGAAPKK